MSVRTIQADVIVSKDSERVSRKKNSKNNSATAMDEPAEFDEEVWCYLCEVAYKHTALINEITDQIKQNLDVLRWIEGIQSHGADASGGEAEQEQAETFDGLVKRLSDDLIGSLKETSQFGGMAGRVYTSATTTVLENFKSWFASEKKRVNSLRGKRKWLEVVESDAALAEISSFSLLEIWNKAREILVQKEADDRNRNSNLFTFLFKKYSITEDVLTLRAIIHLLKNGGKVVEEPEEPEKLLERLEAKRVEIERLQNELPQLPRARNVLPELAFDDSLENLLVLPDPDLEKHNQYYRLASLLLILCSGTTRWIQFEQHLLRVMELHWEKMTSLFYYRFLLWSIFLCTTCEGHYLQLGQYLIQTLKVEEERVEVQLLDWQDSLVSRSQEFLREPKSLPYPIKFGYDDVRAWKMNERGKISFKLNGLGDYTFWVRCNRRQLGLIKIFLEDWNTRNNNVREYSGGSMLLRSVQLVWKLKNSRRSQENRPASNSGSAQLCSNCETFEHYQGKGFWNECKLSIHFTFETTGLTTQGQEKIRQHKLESQQNSLEEKKAKLSKKQDQLNQLEQAVATEKTQALAETAENKIHSEEAEKSKKKVEKLQADIEKLQAHIDKCQQKLERLQQAKPFKRSDRPLYGGISNIFVGVLLDLDKHMVVAVVDTMRDKVLTYRNAKQISKEGASLLRKYSRQQQAHSKQRQKAQKTDRQISLSESELGRQISCLFAKGLVELAQKYNASMIVIPITHQWRERLYSQLEARAKIKCNGNKKAMARYTKEHGEKLHRWAYRRLSQAIVDRAETDGLKVVSQRVEFNEDVFAQAKSLAVAAYDSLRAQKS